MKLLVALLALAALALLLGRGRSRPLPPLTAPDPGAGLRAFSENRERYFWQSRSPAGTPPPELVDLRALARDIRRQ